jgi:hypothetical protein
MSLALRSTAVWWLTIAGDTEGGAAQPGRTGRTGETANAVRDGTSTA